MTARGWVLDPDGGGVKIPERTKEEVRRRLEAYAAKHFVGRYRELRLRFRGPFCYVDAFTDEAVDAPMQICRLRHFATERWTLGFFKYSDEKYELCFVDAADGFWCTVEQGFEVAARAYLR
jgi:hypothetical protein